ncbi:hypothetical protein KIL84_005562 [Mauremys mutica]|uniref:Uncharacterized protein n=1 Tax=Mauremys mutica TaxID=74926 RepID=A0A9D3XGI7_9SAUR|nr:hypothetical protein KIL84_005562 [Mauremys mutica]
MSVIYSGVLYEGIGGSKGTCKTESQELVLGPLSIYTWVPHRGPKTGLSGGHGNYLATACRGVQRALPGQAVTQPEADGGRIPLVHLSLSPSRVSLSSHCHPRQMGRPTRQLLFASQGSADWIRHYPPHGRQQLQNGC